MWILSLSLAGHGFNVPGMEPSGQYIVSVNNDSAANELSVSVAMYANVMRATGQAVNGLDSRVGDR